MTSRESSLISCNHRWDKIVPQGYPQVSLRIVERIQQWDHRGMSTRFLTIADVAEQLQLSAQAVRALIRTGDLPGHQVAPASSGALRIRPWRTTSSASSPRPGPWSRRAGARTRSPEPPRPVPTSATAQHLDGSGHDADNPCTTRPGATTRTAPTLRVDGDIDMVRSHPDQPPHHFSRAHHQAHPRSPPGDLTHQSGERGPTSTHPGVPGRRGTPRWPPHPLGQRPAAPPPHR